MPSTSPARPPLPERTVALLLQGALWLLMAGFFWFWFKRPNYYITGNLWPLVGLFMSFAIVLFNSLVYWIIPRWLLRGRWLLALLGGWALVVAYRFWFYYGAKLLLACLPLSPDLRHDLPDLGGPAPWLVFTKPMYLLGAFVELLADMLFPLIVSFLAYALLVDRRRLALERNHFRLELSYLKAQLNPQFLFNTLGHLQGLTRARDPRAGDVVLHLADLLRYTLYETDAERVPLARELEFTADYLALERLRHPAAAITHTVTGAAEPLRIAPLLLHPLLEQLFVGLEQGGAVAVASTWELAGNSLTLSLERRSARPLPAYATAPAVQAAERRLQLQYPGRHDLRIRETPTQVHVSLHLDL
ncbi:MAG: sensor histidine kinase [Janthinobacterium lividum]